jgi:hypothetical protein
MIVSLSGHEHLLLIVEWLMLDETPGGRYLLLLHLSECRVQVKALLLHCPYEIIRQRRVGLVHGVEIRYQRVVRNWFLLRMENCLWVCMILIWIAMQLSGTLSVRLAQKSSNALLWLSAHGIMASSPHVATASRHNFYLLLPVTRWRLYYGSTIIRGMNYSRGGTWLALLSLPTIWMLLLEGARWGVNMFLMNDDVGVDIGTTQNTSWESCRHSCV